MGDRNVSKYETSILKCLANLFTNVLGTVDVGNGHDQRKRHAVLWKCLACTNETLKVDAPVR
jgi:hypothetical protein